MDWKEQLEALKRGGTLPEGEAPEPEEKKESPKKADKLRVVIDKKGRHGKTATIVEGFTCSDDELKEIAAKLKQKLGTGGSARGGEILLQGERKADTIAALKALGFKAN